jgi:hypothetical protein
MGCGTSSPTQTAQEPENLPDPFLLPDLRASRLAALLEGGRAIGTFAKPRRCSENVTLDWDASHHIVVNGNEGFYEFDFDNSSLVANGNVPFFLIVEFAMSELRPLVLKLDGRLLDVVCGGATGGLRARHVQQHVYGPYSLPAGHRPSTSCLRAETLHYSFPHVGSVAVWSCPRPTAGINASPYRKLLRRTLRGDSSLDGRLRAYLGPLDELEEREEVRSASAPRPRS